jgi:1-deoxy-D-xylulose-5-phosphate reductoisomerase
LSYPDMRLPIQYALTYPDRPVNDSLPRLDWKHFADLTFEPPDTVRFPCLRLAIEAGKKGGTYPAVLCAADEVAVELFLAGSIIFTDISRLVERTLAKHSDISHPSLADIMAADNWARQKTIALVGEGA